MGVGPESDFPIVPREETRKLKMGNLLVAEATIHVDRIIDTCDYRLIKKQTIPGYGGVLLANVLFIPPNPVLPAEKVKRGFVGKAILTANRHTIYLAGITPHEDQEDCTSADVAIAWTPNASEFMGSDAVWASPNARDKSARLGSILIPLLASAQPLNVMTVRPPDDFPPAISPN